jgi:hypothetical protein
MPVDTMLSPIEPIQAHGLAVRLKEQLGSAPIELIYPGAGWDFTSFWAIADPVRAVLVDPAPVTDRPPREGLRLWQSKAIAQLGAPLRAATQFAYDILHGNVRSLSDPELADLTREDCEMEGTLRLGFSIDAIVKGSERKVSFVAARFEEIKKLSGFGTPAHLRTAAILREKWPIVYEHKSMVSTHMMEAAIAARGCLIWGLPTPQNIQWLVD